MEKLRSSFREVLRYPSALVGLAIVLALVLTATWAVIKIPYRQAVALWRVGESAWYQNPKYAAPSWFNLFSRKKLPVSFKASSGGGGVIKTVTPGAQGTGTVELSYTFDYQYDGYPQDLLLYFTTIKKQFLILKLFRKENNCNGDRGIRKKQTLYRISHTKIRETIS